MSSAATIHEQNPVRPGTRFDKLRKARTIAINQVGFETGETKRAVLCLGGGASFEMGHVVEFHSGRVVENAVPGTVCGVENWSGQKYQELDFSAFQGTGTFIIEAISSQGDPVRSRPFVISPRLFAPALAPALLSYFKSQRCDGDYEIFDRKVGFVGNKRAGPVDVRGGWYDASGDVSKYLSHLSYTNFMAPQQIPLVVWALCEAAHAPATPVELREGFDREAHWGGDFLVRMCDPEGMFYMIVFDRWTGDARQREICSYSTQDGHKNDSWEAGFRQGAGMAIAALAHLARSKLSGAFSNEEYLRTAKRAFAHLQTHNRNYLDDGTENIIDDYCALMAVTELFKSTRDTSYLEAAAERANALMERQSAGKQGTGWWWADDLKTRPYFHAAEEGMPVVALVNYHSVAPLSKRAEIRRVLNRAVEYIGTITREQANPFGYPRQYVRSSDGTLKSQFFFPHQNESGYWWQGENARLASLSCALRRAAPLLSGKAVEIGRQMPVDWIDWILGRNPFHTCMMQGFGHNLPDYAYAKIPNADGGICNGITSSLADESDIAFCETENAAQSWRWSEQWIPHAAWFLLAVTSSWNPALGPSKRDKP